MSDLRVEVNWEESGESESSIEYVSSDEVNNISSKQVNVVNEYKNAFLIGTSKFSDNCVYTNYFGGFISRVSSDSQKNIDFTLTLKCVNVSSLTFEFDKTLNIYPTQFFINNIEYKNNSSSYVAIMPQKTTGNITIRFTKMNVANRPLTITFVTSTLMRKYGAESVKNLTIGSNISSESGLSYGVTGKYGSFTLVDNRHEINAILMLVKKYNFECRVFYNAELLGTYKISNIEVGEGKYEYNITLNDFTDDFDESYVKPFFFENVENRKAQLIDFLNIICENSTSKILQSKNIKYSGSNLKNRLTETKMNLIFNSEKKSVMQMLNSFCEIAQVNIIINKEANGLEVIDFG